VTDQQVSADAVSAVSVTPDFLSHVGEPLFVVAGIDKAQAVRALLAGGSAADGLARRTGLPAVELWFAVPDAARPQPM
jgi:6-phosphogluconolactonase/glucosamine-6-phosphate isomerase/deaminase